MIEKKPQMYRPTRAPSTLAETHTTIVHFQSFHPSDVIRGHSSVNFLWVRARGRVRATSIHGKKNKDDVGHATLLVPLVAFAVESRRGVVEVALYGGQTSVSGDNVTVELLE